MQIAHPYNRMITVLGKPKDGAWNISFTDGTGAIIQCPQGSEKSSWEELQYRVREWQVAGNIELAELVISNKWNIYEIDGYEEVLVTLEQVLQEGMAFAYNKIKDGYSRLNAARELFGSMDEILNSFDGFGASDTEPRCYLRGCINQEFEVSI